MPCRVFHVVSRVVSCRVVSCHVVSCCPMSPFFPSVQYLCRNLLNPAAMSPHVALCRVMSLYVALCCLVHHVAHRVACVATDVACCYCLLGIKRAYRQTDRQTDSQYFIRTVCAYLLVHTYVQATDCLSACLSIYNLCTVHTYKLHAKIYSKIIFSLFESSCSIFKIIKSHHKISF